MASQENGQSVALGAFYSAKRLGKMLLSSVEDYASLAGFFCLFLVDMNDDAKEGPCCRDNSS